jgi:hypothetical protein
MNTQKTLTRTTLLREEGKFGHRFYCTHDIHSETFYEKYGHESFTDSFFESKKGELYHITLKDAQYEMWFYTQDFKYTFVDVWMDEALNVWSR